MIRASRCRRFSPFNHVGARKLHAFSAATGDILVEYDHDDILTPNALEEMAAAFKDPNVGFVYSDFAEFDRAIRRFEGTKPTARPPYDQDGKARLHVLRA